MKDEVIHIEKAGTIYYTIHTDLSNEQVLSVEGVNHIDGERVGNRILTALDPRYPAEEVLAALTALAEANAEQG